ncbi:K+/H+ antiporter YhaU regulatory subunit KhtT [Weissella uvarum]|uniref:GntR family transcriptional regulator n=1 Tax=Weissella uvarum TaxID=1479233 RepID=UPI001960E35B|nr:GntR family transcriptional regulator [Weissella uvarum]MBM7617549.1 K+/H+ antiporter YhaU regulatory subunit KhtT [Weissella uvarum]MCM0595569.1 GntR family transcriptional regulator [Weissella uvarum]
MASTKQPRYRQIALDIAEKITANQIKIGDKIHARSKIATTYGVSSETARRAINVLADMDIVQAQHGTGAIVTSRDKAVEFIKIEQASSDLKAIKTDLANSIAEQQTELDHMAELLKTFLQESQSFQQLSPMHPFELKLEAPSDKYGMNLTELNFWHQTGATLVGIEQDGKLTVSPGPYVTFEQGDTIYFVGNEDSVAKVNYFLFNTDN